jgi:hypothetical protein
MLSLRKELGKLLSILDRQIAALCLIHAAKLATRHTKDSVECGLELINPFS